MKGPIAVLTTGRQDWGILRSTCLLLRDDREMELRLMVGGMHNSPAFGDTYRVVEADGFAASERPCWVSAAGQDTARDQAAGALRAVGEALAHQRPRALLIAGDRFETAGAGIAATLEGVPIVHLHGGEQTAGAFDDAFRHAITKLSHLHLVSHAAHRERVIALGEDPETVHVVGAPGLDNVWRGDLPDRPALESALGLSLDPPLVLVTMHPVTAGGDPGAEVEALCAALDAVPATYLVTLPNSDPGHAEVRRRLSEWSRASARRHAVEAVGDRLYWGLMKIADAMVGNSSSALIEAPCVGLPAVNVGERQDGRLRGANVLDAPPTPAAIEAALRRALSAELRRSLAGSGSPFGDGRAAERIVAHLRAWEPPCPVRKSAPRQPA